VTADELRAACLDHLGAVEEFPFGDDSPSVFKVGGKMFAISRLDAEPLAVSLKCEPALAVQLRRVHPEVTPGFHLNKRHWNTVSLAGALDDRTIRDLVEDSYDLVVDGLPRARRPVRRTAS
jgi:predicted DNA-binding protein (MmcQ/YjbR family)